MSSIFPNNEGDKFASYVLFFSIEEEKEEEEEKYVWNAPAAAFAGDKFAQFILGDCYKNGERVAKDLKKAMEWFKKSADQGHASAQNSLGLCYEKGEGVEMNLTVAVEWYSKSAKQGRADAESNLVRLREEQPGLIPFFKESQI